MEISVNNAIILVTVAISYLSFERPQLKAKLRHNPYKVKHMGEYYRLLSSGFIHSNMPHLVFNMLTLFFFGRITEILLVSKYGIMLGSIYFILFYLISIVISDISSVLKFGDSPHFNSLGASGAVSAVLFVSILFFPLEQLYLMFLFPIPAFMLGILYLIYSYFQGQKMADHINHNAHLFGALTGIVFSIIIHPSILAEFFQQIGTYSFF